LWIAQTKQQFSHINEVVPNDRELWVRQQPGSRLRDVVITHPTMAEGLVALFSNVPAT